MIKIYKVYLNINNEEDETDTFWLNENNAINQVLKLRKENPKHYIDYVEYDVEDSNNLDIIKIK